MSRASVRELLLFGIAIVLALIAWSIYATRKKARSVLDASNDPYMAGLFAGLNPQIPAGDSTGGQS